MTRPPVGLALGFVLDRPDHLGHVVTHLVLGALEQDLPGLDLR